MIKLIGWLVLATVLVVGWDGWVKLYNGEASAKQTVREVRQRIGEMILPAPEPEPTTQPPQQSPQTTPKPTLRNAPADGEEPSVWRQWWRLLKFFD
jgi:hypothetical protein